MDANEIRKAIEPKSDQLNADDLIGGPIVVKVLGVQRGDQQQPIVIEIEGHRPYKPSKGMARAIVHLWGPNPSDWVGQSLKLYRDPSVTWAGVAVGGIKISHATGIDSVVELMVTLSKSKRVGHKIQPLSVATDQAELPKPISLDVIKNVYRALMAVRDTDDQAFANEATANQWVYQIKRKTIDKLTQEEADKLINLVGQKPQADEWDGAMLEAYRTATQIGEV